HSLTSSGLAAICSAGWTEFLHLPDRESGPNESVEGAADRAVILHDPIGKPVGGPRPFHEVVVQRPCSAPVDGNRLSRIGRRHVDRVLRREHEASVWN